MSPIFFTVDRSLPLMVIPNVKSHLDGHSVLTYTYDVFFNDAENDPTRVVNNEMVLKDKLDDPNYPNQAADYQHTFAVLEALPCDLFLGAHGAYFGMKTKYPRLQPGATNPFIDPTGYHTYVEERKTTFEKQLAEASAATH